MVTTSRPAGGAATSPSGVGPGKGATTRRALLDAAIARFGREGYRATSVADLARDAGLGGTVAYAYFPNKEALFLAAVDEDAAGLIGEGLAAASDADGEGDGRDWRLTMFFALLEAVDRHPLARRLLAGLEPEVTERVLEIPALTEVRALGVERMAAEQAAGLVRADVDPTALANGIVSIMLSLLMSVVQVGDVVAAYTDDVVAVFTAALGVPRT